MLIEDKGKINSKGDRGRAAQGQERSRVKLKGGLDRVRELVKAGALPAVVLALFLDSQDEET